MRCSESWAARVADIGLVLLLSALGTYLWRGLGVLLSGRISVNGEFQRLRYLDVLLSGAPTALMNRFRRVDAA